MKGQSDSLRTIANKLGLSSFEVIELLQAYAAIIDELKARGIARTMNSPVADYAEWLMATKLGLTLSANSKAGFDAQDKNGLRYQVKSRRMSPKTKSVRLGSIRNLKDNPFDYLLGVIFDYDFHVPYAAKIPWKIVAEESGFSERTNSAIFHLRKSLFERDEVEDITSMLTD